MTSFLYFVLIDETISTAWDHPVDKGLVREPLLTPLGVDQDQAHYTTGRFAYSMLIDLKTAPRPPGAPPHQHAGLIWNSRPQAGIIVPIVFMGWPDGRAGALPVIGQ